MEWPTEPDSSILAEHAEIVGINRTWFYDEPEWVHYTTGKSIEHKAWGGPRLSGIFLVRHAVSWGNSAILKRSSEKNKVRRLFISTPAYPEERCNNKQEWGILEKCASWEQCPVSSASSHNSSACASHSSKGWSQCNQSFGVFARRRDRMQRYKRIFFTKILKR